MVRTVDPTTGYPLEQTYRRGRLHGVWRSFSKSNRLTCEAHFRAGVLHGPYRVWNEAGDLIHQCCYRRGRLHGTEVRFLPTGEEITRVHYAFGVPLLRGLNRVSRSRKNERRWIWISPLLVITALGILGWQAPYLLVCFAVLYLVILLHELGHALAAKWTGVWLSSFVVGVGPRIVDFQFGTTRVIWRAIPIFGYVIPRQLTKPEHDWLADWAGDKRTACADSEPVHFWGAKRVPDFHHVGRLRSVLFFLGGVLLQLLLASVFFSLSILGSNSESQQQLSIPIATPKGMSTLYPQTDKEIALAKEILKLEAELERWDRTERELRPLLKTDEAAVDEWVRVLRKRSKLTDQISLQRDQLMRAVFARRQNEASFGIFEKVGRRFVNSNPFEAFQTFAWINFYMAVFNLMPIPGFDGFQVLRISFGQVSKRPIPMWLQTILAFIGVVVAMMLLFHFTQQFVRELWQILTR